MSKAKFKPGDAIYVDVGQEQINGSDPCNKDKCMLTRAFNAHLVAQYGEQNFKVKSTNHGVIFQLNGRDYVAVFDTKTATKIYNYDQTYRKTHSKDAARSKVRPFKARVMIEASTAVPKWPPMSEETRKKLKAYPRKPKSEHQPKRSGSRRELSL